MERVLELTRKAAAVLEERGLEQPRLDAELLLAGVLGLKRLDLYLQHDRPLSADELERYRTAVRRRLKREPVQYILGTAAFRHLELRVDRRVLIPRPETEQLVGAVLEWSRSRNRWGALLDIGTGSGAIALSLAAEGRFEKIVASDVSQDALDVASDNATRLGLAHRIDLRRGSLLDVVRPGEKFDVIVSNPPYIAESERASLAPEVVQHEPALALFGGPDGLSVIEGILRAAAACLMPGGLLALETAPGQGAGIEEELGRGSEYGPVEVRRDLAGRERMVLAERRRDDGGTQS
ncbi:MAG TPA: peptide chain release factor N(5)-glutamine methyltransferase [Longimicrobiales bacterium]